MNEIQKRAIEELSDKNKQYIREIDDLLKIVTEKYSKYDEYETAFWGLMNDMNRASSNLPYAPYHNAYCVKGNNFKPPQGPALTDILYGTLSNEFRFLSEEWMNNTEKWAENNAKLLKIELSENVEALSELLNKIIASNSITKRLSGLEDKSIELSSFTKLFWYPKELSQNEYSFKGSFPVPISLHYPQLALPFHRYLIINYDYLFKSKDTHIGILKNTKKILEYINEFLPFAELIPLRENTGIIVTNTVTPREIHIGSENNFEGEIKIGNEGGI